ncbi:proline rich transmembrane protein 1B [Labrus bergylta]|uniref:proline rich transmembrane protein 1B n=1 Tax=Labrus bergylta TaxID=56723 RepID=UPI0009B3ED22|nr:proline-rich transmembrane protein 1-like [Labrus bergylta]
MMDPDKSASAPPTNWTGEKSSMGQAAPPPYQDNPHPWHPQQPGQGYPPQPQGYAAPPQQYGGPGYGPQPFPVGQPYPGQPASIIVQPTQYVTPIPLQHPVNDYLCYSVFTMICCCLPLGVAALIYSISAREANIVGDRITAERSSRTSRTLNHVALGIGIGVFILSIVYLVVMTSMLNK